MMPSLAASLCRRLPAKQPRIALPAVSVLQRIMSLR